MRDGILEQSDPIAVMILRSEKPQIDLSQYERGAFGQSVFLCNVFRRLVMSLKHNAGSPLLAVFALASFSLATVAEAQPYGPGQGGGMMGGDWGWGMGYGMGGFGGIGVLVLALVVLGIAVVTVRRRNT
jgi:hypothetical protein